MQKDSGVFSAATDAELASLAAQGNGDAFALLMHRLMPVMKKLAARYQAVPGLEADDLVQEGLMGLLSAVHAYRPGHDGFSPFAAACIRNRMVSAVRRSLPVGAYETADADNALSAYPSGQADPAQVLVEREEADRLRRRLQKLLTPLEYRVLTAYLGGRNYGEIADAIGVSVKTVDNALQRVRKKLPQDSWQDSRPDSRHGC